MLDNKVVFIFYLAAVVCFLLAAFATGRPGMSRGAMSRVSLVPLGLALFVFPSMWNAAVAGF